MAIETCDVAERSHPAEETRPPTGLSGRNASCEVPANSTGIYQELPVETRLMKTNIAFLQFAQKNSNIFNMPFFDELAECISPIYKVTQQVQHTSTDGDRSARHHQRI